MQAETQGMPSCCHRRMQPCTLRLWLIQHNLKEPKKKKTYGEKTLQTKNNLCSNKHGILHVCKDHLVGPFKCCIKQDIDAVFHRAIVIKLCKLVKRKKNIGGKYGLLQFQAAVTHYVQNKKWSLIKESSIILCWSATHAKIHSMSVSLFGCEFFASWLSDKRLLQRFLVYFFWF